ncbi:phosphotransferase [uncultured Bacteroides sp.]|uniref:phosphotransferase n=1 Tax=uncultured Bacteroides sp. TaxID=162156 RepID=UPI0025DBF02A|nr:phosphotransferase [uncultured Bacteroides sp.]
MRVIINPKYYHLEESIKRIPELFEKQGRVLYDRRNLIKEMLLEDSLLINVKRYGVPKLINRIAYSFFRRPKGERAFIYPQILLQKGFETPEPIAYIEFKKNGLIDYSYFVSVQCPYQRTFYEFGDADPNSGECVDIIQTFAHYTASLHENGILHQDYSPGNILFDKIGNNYRFSLVDLNRMTFGEVGLEAGCANFARLWGQKEFFVQLAKAYAKARHWDEAYCVGRVLFYRKAFWSKYQKRHELKFHLEL